MNRLTPEALEPNYIDFRCDIAACDGRVRVSATATGGKEAFRMIGWRVYIGEAGELWICPKHPAIREDKGD